MSRINYLSMLIFVTLVVILLLLPMSQADVMDTPFESLLVYLPIVRGGDSPFELLFVYLPIVSSPFESPFESPLVDVPIVRYGVGVP